jgi:GNAT superfamily N-acetyltransferase
VSGGVAVRRAGPDDVRVLAEVHLHSALVAYAGVFPAEAPTPTVDGLVARWRQALADPRSEVFAAQVGGAVVGGVIATTATRPGVGNLRHLYVDPPHWGRGAGRALHDRVVEWCSATGLTTLDLWVLEANGRARAMYERWGWQVSDGDRLVNEGSEVREVRYVLDRVTGP